MDGWSQSCKKIQSVLISRVMSAYAVKNCFSGRPITVYNHTRSQARDLRPTHRKQTVGLRCIYAVQVIMEKTYFVQFDGQMLDRLLLQIRPVTEKRHSTGTDPADMPLIKQYVQQVAVTFLICSISFPKK